MALMPICVFVRLATAKYPESKIIAIDDNPANLELVQAMLATAGYENVICIDNPFAAVQAVLNSGADLAILDLHMPGKSGLEVLAEIRRHLAVGDFFPVLVFTADGFPETKANALQAGANDFLTKPGDLTEITLRVGNLLETRHLHRRTLDQNKILEEMVRLRTSELEASRREILDKLVWTAEYRDDETGEHSYRVAQVAAAIAKEMGLPDLAVEHIRLATPLHDLGKIGIPDSILLKPAKLSPEEYEQMQLHVEIGSKILGNSQSVLMQMAHAIARCHHERWDGSGYPAGLRREEIPFEARIVAVADVFDALTSERPYKHAWPFSLALKEIISLSGIWFDPSVVKAFERISARSTEQERAA